MITPDFVTNTFCYLSVLIGQPNDFEEFKSMVEKLLEDLWMLIFEERQVDLARLMESKSVRLSQSFLNRLSTYFFGKFLKKQLTLAFPGNRMIIKQM